MPNSESTGSSESTQSDRDQQRPEYSLLVAWLQRAHFVLDAHHTAAGFLDRRHYWLGIPSIALSTLVGTAIFASLQANPGVIVQIIVGLASVSAAVLASLQTFLRFSERAEKHRVAGVRYGAIMRELEELLLVPPESVEELRRRIEDIRIRWDKLNEDTPLMLRNAWKDTEKRASRNTGDE